MALVTYRYELVYRMSAEYASLKRVVCMQAVKMRLRM